MYLSTKTAPETKMPSSLEGLGEGGGYILIYLSVKMTIKLPFTMLKRHIDI